MGECNLNISELQLLGWGGTSASKDPIWIGNNTVGTVMLTCGLPCSSVQYTLPSNPTIYSTVGERQQCLCEFSLGMLVFSHSQKICTVGWLLTWLPVDVKVSAYALSVSNCQLCDTLICGTLPSPYVSWDWVHTLQQVWYSVYKKNW